MIDRMIQLDVFIQVKISSSRWALHGMSRTIDRIGMWQRGSLAESDGCDQQRQELV